MPVVHVNILSNLKEILYKVMKHKCKIRIVLSMKTNFSALENIKSVSLNIAFEFGVDNTANIGKTSLTFRRCLNSDFLPIFFR